MAQHGVSVGSGGTGGLYGHGVEEDEEERELQQLERELALLQHFHATAPAAAAAAAQPSLPAAAPSVEAAQEMDDAQLVQGGTPAGVALARCNEYLSELDRQLLMVRKRRRALQRELRLLKQSQRADPEDAAVLTAVRPPLDTFVGSTHYAPHGSRYISTGFYFRPDQQFYFQPADANAAEEAEAFAADMMAAAAAAASATTAVPPEDEQSAAAALSQPVSAAAAAASAPSTLSTTEEAAAAAAAAEVGDYASALEYEAAEYLNPYQSANEILRAATNGQPEETVRMAQFRLLDRKLSSLYREEEWTEAELVRLWNAVRTVRRLDLRRQLLLDPQYAFLTSRRLHQLSNAQQTQFTDLKQRIQAIDAASDQELLYFQPGDIDWLLVASCMDADRSASDCQTRWTQFEDPKLNKAPWAPEEDAVLLRLKREQPQITWQQCAEQLHTNRTAVQCLMRYQQSLNPTVLNSKWTAEEDAALVAAVQRCGDADWLAVARELPNRSAHQCMHRWHKSLDPSIKKGRWTEDESAVLMRAVELYGMQWSKVAQMLPGRTGQQCRERYCNVARPGLMEQIDRPWTQEEDEALRETAAALSFKWADVAAAMAERGFPRTDNRCLRRYQIIEPEAFEERLGERHRRQKLVMRNFSGATQRKHSRPAVDKVMAATQPVEAAGEQTEAPVRKKRGRPPGKRKASEANSDSTENTDANAAQAVAEAAASAAANAAIPTTGDSLQEQFQNGTASSASAPTRRSTRRQ